MQAKLGNCSICHVQALIPDQSAMPGTVLCFYCLRTAAHYDGFMAFRSGASIDLARLNAYGDAAGQDYRLGWLEAEAMTEAGAFGAVHRNPAFLRMIDARHEADRRRREYVGQFTLKDRVD